MSEPVWLQRFREPAAENRPQPFWSWNGDLDEVRIDAMAELFAAQGCGGVFVHPRPGLVTEYLSPRWFELWRHAAARCRALGMACHIYDENSFPSGFAGGHVVASDPRTAATVLAAHRREDATPPPGTVVTCADPATGALLPIDAWRGASAARPVLALCAEAMQPNAWHAGFPIPDISLPETGRAFIASTHAAYARESGGHLGTTARLVFTDEPTLPRREGAVTWSSLLREAYAADHGHRLEERLALLFLDLPGHEAVRHDYHATLQRLVCANFFRPIHDWCAEHGVGFTGHVDEHLWPDPAFLPSAAGALRWMQVPGNDLLAFQFTPQRRDDPLVALARLNLRELDAVARQCGRERTLVESSGGGGYAFGPAQMKPLEDWAMALGVGLMNPHLAHVSLIGSRKYDWPQTISDHSPWATDYRPHADHVGRVLTALRQGTVERRVAVLLPTTTAWLHARPGLGKDGPLQRLRVATLALVDALEAAGIDWDPVDEGILAELGRIADGRLVVGACAYRAVVVPAAMANWEEATLALVGEALAAGIPVHAEAGYRPAFVAGRPDPRPAVLAGWRDHGGATALAAALGRDFPPHLAAADGGPLPRGLAWRRVATAEGDVVFVCNPWNEPIRGELRLPGSALTALDTATGASRAAPSRRHDAGQVVAIDLPPGGHALWLCRKAAVAAAVPAAPAWRTQPLRPTGIAADHANALVLDHVVLEVPGHPAFAGTTPRADTALWTAMGFAQPAWDRSIQYRRRFVDEPLADRPGFRVTYEAELDPGVDPAGFRLAVEQPRLYRVEVNGEPVDGWTPWFDPECGSAAVGRHLRPGRNRFVLVAERFRIRHEIAAAYLLGDFALRACAHGFAVAPPRPLGLGDWRELGRPLACGAMTYAWEAGLDRPARRLRLRLPRWAGATWRLRVDGTLVGRAAHGQDELEVETPLAAGRHEVAVEIVSHAAGLLGPHHGDGVPGRWSWERPWEPARAEPPPGADWRVPATGMLAPPELALA